MPHFSFCWPTACGLWPLRRATFREELARRTVAWGDVISLDTKHIIAFVQENNPKAYVASRFNKDQQPAGDPESGPPSNCVKSQGVDR